LYLRGENDQTKKSRNEILKQLETDESLKITVPVKLVNPDKLIAEVEDDIFKRRVWNKNEDIVYNSSGYLSIRVSPKNIHRALIVLDTLIKVLKQRGHSVTIEYNTTFFIIEGEKIPICCREKQTRVLVKGTYSDSYDNKPQG
jgi:formylmethanofuran dehydrogenase subunit C